MPVAGTTILIILLPKARTARKLMECKRHMTAAKAKKWNDQLRLQGHFLLHKVCTGAGTGFLCLNQGVPQTFANKEMSNNVAIDPEKMTLSPPSLFQTFLSIGIFLTLLDQTAASHAWLAACLSHTFRGGGGQVAWFLAGLSSNLVVSV